MSAEAVRCGQHMGCDEILGVLVQLLAREKSSDALDLLGSQCEQQGASDEFEQAVQTLQDQGDPEDQDLAPGAAGGPSGQCWHLKASGATPLSPPAASVVAYTCSAYSPRRCSQRAR